MYFWHKFITLKMQSFVMSVNGAYNKIQMQSMELVGINQWRHFLSVRNIIILQNYMTTRWGGQNDGVTSYLNEFQSTYKEIMKVASRSKCSPLLYWLQKRRKIDFFIPIHIKLQQLAAAPSKAGIFLRLFGVLKK